MRSTGDELRNSVVPSYESLERTKPEDVGAGADRDESRASSKALSANGMSAAFFSMKNIRTSSSVSGFILCKMGLR
jgi:hypothetical protein